MSRISVLALLILSVGVADAQDIAITGARIIDGTGRVIERGTVVIRGGRIVSITAGDGGSSADAIIDATGKTLMPAFIDGHRHVIRGDATAWMRNQAAERMQRALRELKITGVATNVAFLRTLVESELFAGGQYHTGSVEDCLDQLVSLPTDEQLERIAVVAAVVHREIERHRGAERSRLHSEAAASGAWVRAARRHGLQRWRP